VAATSFNPRRPDEFSLLLDQGFPKPTAFAVAELDRTVTVRHLSDFAPELAERSTPDWYVYCAAAERGFDALVVRDRSQLDQLAEMYVLSRLVNLTVVTWRRGIDDPVREWGQLLAYLPQVRQRCLEAGGRVILLPAPTLANDCYYDPRLTLSSEARAEIEDWLFVSDEPADRFDRLLGH
jgi:hypothetical protein